MELQQRQKQVSKTESLELVLSLFRMSTFQICYLRRLFPERSFHSKHIRSLENMPVQVLAPTCKESRRLIDWVESGAADAIKRQYLKRLFFGISKDADGTDLIEQYQFSVSYSGDNVQFKFAGSLGGKRRSSKGVNIISADHVRREWTKILRMLVSLCVSLDDVPPERYLFMKMTYYDHCPDEYEPPFFVALDPNRVGRFSREPFVISVGTMNTPHHNVMLKCKTLLDRTGEEEDYDTDSVLDEESIEATSITTQSRGRNSKSIVSKPNQGVKINVKRTSKDSEIINKENIPSNSMSSVDSILDKVVDICSCLSQVSLCDIREKLPDKTEKEISQCLAQLSLKGALIRSYRPNTFIVESRHEYFKRETPPKKDFDDQNNISFSNSSLRARIGSNGADSERTDSLIKSRESRCGIQRQHRPNLLQQRTGQSAVDSDSLPNATGRNTPTSRPQPENDRLTILPSSQDTMNGNSRLRKASFVENPIENRVPDSKRRCLRNTSTQD